MANETAIGWTDLSWNPVHGCSKVSPGCAHCYAETLSLQRGHTTAPWTPENAAENVILKPKKLGEPFSGAKVWRGLGEAAARAGKTDGKLVFVNSMSDLFHEEISNEFIAAVFGVMALAEKHTFQILTKRPERMRDWFAWYDGQCAERELVDDERTWFALAAAADLGVPRAHTYAYSGIGIEWPLRNVWAGVSIENRRYVDRADVLRETPAAVRFISAEPLLGPLVYDGSRVSIDLGRSTADESAIHVAKAWADGHAGPELDLTDIDWLIAGGESGPGHRPMRDEWVRDLRDACAATGPVLGSHSRRTAFFYKQKGGARPTSGGRELDGRMWDEFPRVREAVVA